MRSYQLEGLSWLVHTFRHGVNGILADEMVTFYLLFYFWGFGFMVCRNIIMLSCV